MLAALPPGTGRTEDAVVDVLYSMLAGQTDPGGRIRRYSLAYADALQLARSMNFDDVVEAVERHLSLFIAEFAKRRVFVHAGAVGWNGRAVLIPGESMSGKSTLVAALVEAGATYYSDEFAVIGPGGRVYPYPRPLQLRHEGRPSQRLSPGAVGTKPLRVGLVLQTRYRGGVAFRPHQISKGQALLALLGNTVSAQRNPDQALRTLAKSLAGARCVKGSRSEADMTVRELLSRRLLPPTLDSRERLTQLSA